MLKPALALSLSVCFVALSVLSSTAFGEENEESIVPTNFNLELLVITRQLEGPDAGKKSIVSQVEEVVVEHGEQSLSEIQQALDRQIRIDLGKREACNLEAFILSTYDDLEQWVKFGTTPPRSFFGGKPTGERQGPPVIFGETKVLATPRLVGKNKIRLGVTVEQMFPGTFPGDSRPGMTAVYNGGFSYTSNTMVDLGQTVLVNSYRHVGEGATTEIIVVGRVTD